MADLITDVYQGYNRKCLAIGNHRISAGKAYGFLEKVESYRCDTKDILSCIGNVSSWIPCSERLPEIKKDHESDCVLCYCDTGAYAFSTLQENFFGQIGFACEKEDDYYHSIGKAIAWMPLPEPPESEVQK